MIADTISTAAARRFYDWLGARHDLGSRFERRAKQRALARLELAPGLAVLNVGAGTGVDQARIRRAIGPDGLAAAVDISRMMLALTRERVFDAALVEADARRLPFRAAAFDRLLCTYVLDLLPLQAIPGILVGFRRVLAGNGRLVLVALTTGVDPLSRAVVALWEAVYARQPLACGGCRPLELAELVRQAGFTAVEREVIVQAGVPSEIIIGEK